MRNHKVLYLFILFILWLKEWGIKPFGSLPSDFHLVISVLYMMLGFYWFRKNPLSTFNRYGKKAYSLIIIGILLSMIPALVFHNQNIIQSIITYRPQIYWLVIPLLFKIGATEEEMIKLFKYCTYLLVFVFFIKLNFLDLFVLDDLVLERIKTGEHPYTVSGYWMFTLPIFWYLMHIKMKFDWKYLIPIAICYVFIFLMENRSTLFPITLMIIYVIVFAAKTRKKPFIVFLFAVASFIVISYTQDKWLSLFEETTSQVDNTDYATNVEISYFLSSEANPSIITWILGNGFVSKHDNAWVEKLYDLKIFNSDVGFIGFWNLYGILPVFVFIYTMFYAIKSRKTPYYLKLWAIQMLSCSLTISYFALPVHMIYYAMFFYLFYLNRAKQYE